MSKYNSEYRHAYYLKNKEKSIEWQLQWKKRNPDLVKKQFAKWSKTVLGRFGRYKGSAKERGLQFNISLEQFRNLVDRPCVYCGEIGVGIDRVDNSIGYIWNNVATCCTTCNRMKLNYSKEEFIEKCKQIVENIT